MCGRFALSAPAAQLIEFFELDECADFLSRLNIAPGTDIPVIRQSPEGKRVLHLLRWGLLPHWVKDPQSVSHPINARLETLREKPYFRSAYQKRRCLVPASGFYEWKREGKRKEPYYFSNDSGELMAMAGLWESWKAPDGSILRTVCLITTDANAVMQPIHDRMPVFIGKQDWRAWFTGEMTLDQQTESAASKSPSLQRTPADKMLL